jgi:hypothetical protein
MNKYFQIISLFHMFVPFCWRKFNSVFILYAPTKKGKTKCWVSYNQKLKYCESKTQGDSQNQFISHDYTRN